MRIVMEDGTAYETQIQDPSGSTQRPMTREQAMNNARELLRTAYAGREEEVIGNILNMKERDRVGF